MKKSEYNKIIDAAIDLEKKYIAEHEEIKEILLSLVLKPINGVTLNKNVLGKFTFKRQFGMFYIIGEFEHLIGYEGINSFIAVEPVGESKGFIYYDNCHGGAAKERVVQLEANRERAYPYFKKVSKLFNEMRTAFGDIERDKVGSYHFPAYYELLRSISGGLSESIDHNVKIDLNKFYYIRK